MAAVVVPRPSLTNKIEDELERAKEKLQGVDDSLRRLTGREMTDGRPERRPRISDVSGRDEEPPAKRQSIGGGVFARLGGMVDRSPERGDMNGGGPRGRGGMSRGPPRRVSRGGGRDRDGGPFGGLENRRESREDRDFHGRDREDFRSPPRREGPAFAGRGWREGGDRGGRGRRESRGEGRAGGPQAEEGLADIEQPIPKPAVASAVARVDPEAKARVEAAALPDRARNRRMFGALLGTLQSFKKDEAKQKSKGEQRQAVEKKLEQKGLAEQEELRMQKRRLWEERREKQIHISKLRDHAQRAKEHESWAAYKRQLCGFIRTNAAPAIFWLPRFPERSTDKLIKATSASIDAEIQEKKDLLEEELQELLSKGGDLPPELGREQHDYVDYGGDEGDLDYDEAGRDVVWRPPGRGKAMVDSDGEGSLPEGDGGLGTLQRTIRPGGKLARHRDGHERGLTRGTGEDVLLRGRMVVQVGESGGAGAGGRRVVEVVTPEDAGARDGGKRKGAESGMTKSERLKLLAADMKDITIKVERGVDGAQEVEERKVVVEKTASDKTDKHKDKSKKKHKADKTKDVNKENELEDEVTRMRKRIVEKARRIVENEEKERNQRQTMNGEVAVKHPKKEKSEETSNRKAAKKADEASRELSQDMAEALKDITEGVADEEAEELEEEQDEMLEAKKKQEETLNEANDVAAPSVAEEQQPAAAVAGDAVADSQEAESNGQEDALKLQVGENDVITMQVEAFEEFNEEEDASQLEPATDALQLTLDPMEKAMMDEEADAMDTLVMDTKKSSKPSSSSRSSKPSAPEKSSKSDSRSSKKDAKSSSKTDKKSNSSSSSDGVKVDVKSKCDERGVMRTTEVNVDKSRTKSARGDVPVPESDVTAVKKADAQLPDAGSQSKSKDRARTASSAYSNSDSKTDKINKTKKPDDNPSPTTTSSKKDKHDNKRQDKAAASSKTKGVDKKETKSDTCIDEKFEERQSIQITVANPDAIVESDLVVNSPAVLSDKTSKKHHSKTQAKVVKEVSEEKARETKKDVEAKKVSKDKENCQTLKKVDEKRRDSEKKSLPLPNTVKDLAKSKLGHRSETEKSNQSKKDEEKSQKEHQDKKKTDKKIVEKSADKKDGKKAPEPEKLKETEKVEKRSDKSSNKKGDVVATSDRKANSDTHKRKASNEDQSSPDKKKHKESSKHRHDASTKTKSLDKHRRQDKETNRKSRHDRDESDSSSDDEQSSSSSDASDDSSLSGDSSDDDSSDDSSDSSSNSSSGDSGSESDNEDGKGKKSAVTESSSAGKSRRDPRANLRARCYSDSESESAGEEEEEDNRMRNPQKKSKQSASPRGGGNSSSKNSKSRKAASGERENKRERERESDRRKERKGRSSRDRQDTRRDRSRSREARRSKK